MKRPAVVEEVPGNLEWSWNPTDPTMEVVELELDASGGWGCAAVWGPHWLQWQWSNKAQLWHIAPKELLPILLARAV